MLLFLALIIIIIMFVGKQYSCSYTYWSARCWSLKLVYTPPTHPPTTGTQQVNKDDICHASSYWTNLKTITSELITKEILVLVNILNEWDVWIQRKFMMTVSIQNGRQISRWPPKAFWYWLVMKLQTDIDTMIFILCKLSCLILFTFK